MVESGGKWSLIPGSELDTSRAPVGVTEQLSFIGRDTAINQENCLTAQQASYRCIKRSFFSTKFIICTTKTKIKLEYNCNKMILQWEVLYFTLAGRPPG